MISYKPLWETMRRKGATTYTLRGGQYRENGVGGTTMVRLQNGESVSTNTLDTICRILDCKVSDVIEYIPDTEA